MKTLMALGIAITASTALATGGAVRAQDATGEWHGALNIPQGPTLRVGLTLKKAKVDDLYEGSISSPDQSPNAMPLDTAKVENGTLSFAVAAIMGSYSGKWDPARKAWVGEWTQVGTPMPLVLTAGKP
jgi:hypothetical protein